MERKITLDLTMDDVNRIMEGIAELPIKTGMATFMKVRQQTEAQLNPQVNVPEDNTTE